MTKLLGRAVLAVVATMAAAGIAVGQTHDLERRIWSLLDDAKAPFVALPRQLAAAHYSVVRWLVRSE